MPQRKVFNDSDDDDYEKSELFSSKKQDIGEEEDDEEDDDDEAPEEKTFKEGKKTMLDQVRSAIKQIENEKSKKKELRRKRDVAFKEQKKQKLAKLEMGGTDNKSRDKISGQPSKKASSSAEQNTHEIFNDDSLSEGSSSHDDADEKDDKNEPEVVDKNAGIKAVCLKDLSTSLAQDAAAQFRKQRLLGSGVPRQSIRDKMAVRVKQQAGHRKTTKR